MLKKLVLVYSECGPAVCFCITCTKWKFSGAAIDQNNSKSKMMERTMMKNIIIFIFFFLLGLITAKWIVQHCSNYETGKWIHKWKLVSTRKIADSQAHFYSSVLSLQLNRICSLRRKKNKNL